MKINKLLVAGMLVLLSATFCNAEDLNQKAETTAVNFYKDLQKKDFAATISLCSEKAFEANSKEEWTRALLKNSVLLGAMKSFTKTNGQNISTAVDDAATITIAYDIVWQYGKSRDSIIMIQEKDGSMKVYSYTWKQRDTKYLAEVVASENAANTYMNFVKDGNYDAAVAMCSEEALKITSKEAWKTFFNNANKKYGNISAYNVITDSSYYNIEASGETGKGNYYDIYVKTIRDGQEVMERIVFFQKNYEEKIKLAGHFFQ